MRTRAAGPADARAILDLVAAGFESYRSWADPGWRAPAEPIGTVEELTQRLEDQDVSATLAEEGGEAVGVVAFKPLLTERATGDPVPGTAHFWLLFVRADRCGKGIGRALHDLAVAEVRARGYLRAHLWTPAGARAARSLYEASGWTAKAVFHEERLRLELCAYELELG